MKIETQKIETQYIKDGVPYYIFYGGRKYRLVESKAKRCPECGRQKVLWIVCPECGYEYEEPRYDKCAWCGKEYRVLRKRQKYCSQECHQEHDKEAAKKRSAECKSFQTKSC